MNFKCVTLRVDPLKIFRKYNRIFLKFVEILKIVYFLFYKSSVRLHILHN